jgi:superoxide dismutase
MERIRFPKFVIDKCPHNELLIWKNKRGKDTRVLIFNEKEGYLVVLTERKTFNLFWTAYYIEYKHQRKKYVKEYEDYIKTKTA